MVVSLLSSPLFSSPLGVRGVTRHTPRIALGHKLEVIWGKHRSILGIPPSVPKHPLLDTDKNMNQLTTYADLKLRWKKTINPSRKTMNIARKWKTYSQRNDPRPRPTCLFVSHDRMPYSDPNLPKPPALPPPGMKLNTEDAFAVFKSNIRLQHKVTVGDIVQTERMYRRQAGDRVTFGTVLMAGSKDWTIIGKPTVPYAKVHCTVEQQTLTRELLVFKYKAKRRYSRFWRVRQWVTMLRVDSIEVDPNMHADAPPPKPLRLLDLWSNRWLSAEELKGIEYEDEDKTIPSAAVHHDGSEHTPGAYMFRGLCEAHRYWPDPQAHNLTKKRKLPMAS